MPKEQLEVVSDPETDSYDSESDITEDEDGLDLTPALDAAILRTLGKIRRGEGVYNAERVLEAELAAAEAEALKRGVKPREARKGEEKPYLLADHHRAALLSGRVNDVDEEEEEARERGWGWRPPPPLTHVQEERKMRREAIEAFNALGEEEGEDEFVPVKRETAVGGEAEKDEDEAYRKFLLEMGGGEDEVRRLLGMGDQPVSHVREEEEEGGALEDGTQVSERKESKKRKKRLERQKKNDDEFLMGGWIDKEEKDIPTYDQITAVKKQAAEEESEDGDAAEQAGPSHPWGSLEEEDDFDERAEEFETQYNFRFEEPGAADIPSHPRQIPSLVRRADDTRKLKREARAARKEEERLAKEEETRRVKGKKRREMEGQLKALRDEIGEKGWKRVEEVLEGDYEEGEWERVVGEVLAGLGDEAGEEEEEEKPSWDDEEGEGGEWGGEAWGKEAGDDEDGPVNMDADFIGFDDGGKKKHKKDKKGKGKDKGKSKLQQDDDETEQVEEDLTVAERANKVKEAMNEYQALDHEDMIGDMPTRFHYTSTAPTAYGLTPAEILMATDDELNQLLSVKHIAPYRRGGLGMQGKGYGQRMRMFKDGLVGRKWGEEAWVPRGAGAGAGSASGNGNGWQGRPGGRQQDGGWAQRGAAAGAGAGGAGGEGKKKRAGKNERKRKADAMGPGTGTGAEGGSGDGASAKSGHASGAPASAERQIAQMPVRAGAGEGGDGEASGEGKKKRRKKRKSGAGGEVE